MYCGGCLHLAWKRTRRVLLPRLHTKPRLLRSERGRANHLHRLRKRRTRQHHRRLSKRGSQKPNVRSCPRHPVQTQSVARALLQPNARPQNLPRSSGSNHRRSRLQRPQRRNGTDQDLRSTKTKRWNVSCVPQPKVRQRTTCGPPRCLRRKQPRLRCSRYLLTTFPRHPRLLF